MLKILQITSFILLAVSVATGIWVLVNYDQIDGYVRDFIDSPLTADKYKGNITAAIAADGSKPPLVSEAEELSLRLNPPPPPRQQPTTTTPSAPRTPQTPTTAPARPQAPVIAKFDLIGTCVNHSAPELSMIYIDVPGEGRKWVYQGETVGRLEILEITETAVVYTDGGVENELALTVQPATVKSLLLEDQPEQTPVAASQLPPAATEAGVAPSRQPPAVAQPSAGAARRPAPIRTAPPAARTATPRPAPVAPSLSPQEQKAQLESSLQLMADWKTGDEEADKQLAETMKSLEKFMTPANSQEQKE